jgi:hypothetical protein
MRQAADRAASSDGYRRSKPAVEDDSKPRLIGFRLRDLTVRNGLFYFERLHPAYDTPAAASRLPRFASRY